MKRWSDYLGSVDRDAVENVINEEIQAETGSPPQNIDLIEGENKLSDAFNVDNNYIVKIIMDGHYRYHKIIISLRNYGLSPYGGLNLFEPYESHKDMAKYEFDKLKEMERSDIPVPTPVSVVSQDNFSLLMMEMLNDPLEFNEITDNSDAVRFTKSLFTQVNRMHSRNIAHGDIQTDNVLISDDQMYFIDPSSINANVNDNTWRHYDIGSALVTATSVIDESMVAEIAPKYFEKDALRESLRILPLICIQWGHDFEANKIRNELDI